MFFYFSFRTVVFRFAQNVFLNFYEGRTQSLNLSGLPASFHYAVLLKGGRTQSLNLSGLPFFALLKTSSLTSTRGVPKPFQQSTSCFVVFFNFHQLTWASSRRCLKLKNPVPINRDRVCAQNRNRTCTSLRTLDFESSASTNSAIWAGLQYYAINENLPKYDLGIFSCSNTPLFAAFLLGK